MTRNKRPPAVINSGIRQYSQPSRARSRTARRRSAGTCVRLMARHSTGVGAPPSPWRSARDARYTGTSASRAPRRPIGCPPLRCLSTRVEMRSCKAGEGRSANISCGEGKRASVSRTSPKPSNCGGAVCSSRRPSSRICGSRSCTGRKREANSSDTCNVNSTASLLRGGRLNGSNYTTLSRAGMPLITARKSANNAGIRFSIRMMGIPPFRTRFVFASGSWHII
jgi:hypothetical protein